MARIVGLDLGSYSVKVVRIEPRGKGGFDVTGAGEVLVPPPAEGEDAAATLADRHGVALAELKQRGLLSGDVFVTGLPGDAVAMRTLPFTFSDPKKIAEALPFALESEIPLDLEDIVLTWTTLSESARKKADGGKETEVLVAFARKEAMQAHLNLLAVHGIDPRHVEFDALALDDLWDGLLKNAHDVEGQGPTAISTSGGTVIEFGEGAPDPAVALVDIGHRRTSVCVMSRGQVISAHTLLHGGADATRALARELGLPQDEAERGKRKEAFIEVVGAEAQFPEQRQISDVLKTAYSPVIRRLRQIFQATIASARVRVVKVVVTGGGSAVMNLDRHMAEELNVKVARGREVAVALRSQAGQLPGSELEGHDSTSGALALAYALSGMAGPRTRSRIDFRTGEFAWHGDFEFLRDKAPQLGAWAAALLVLVLGSSVAQAVVLGSQVEELEERQAKACREITGQEIDSAQRCLAMINERINGTAGFNVPEVSAADIYLEISKRLPPAATVKRKVIELDISPERARMKGTTSAYDAVDQLNAALVGGRCFKNVENGKVRNIAADSVEWNVTIELDCAGHPGDGKEIPPPPSSTVRATAKPYTPPTPVPAADAVAPAMKEEEKKEEKKEEPKAEEPTDPQEVAKPDRPSKLTPEDMEARRERIRRLREERESRLKGLNQRMPMQAPIDGGGIRERLRRGEMSPALRDRRGAPEVVDGSGDEGGEE